MSDESQIGPLFVNSSKTSSIVRLRFTVKDKDFFYFSNMELKIEKKYICVSYLFVISEHMFTCIIYIEMYLHKQHSNIIDIPGMTPPNPVFLLF